MKFQTLAFEEAVARAQSQTDSVVTDLRTCLVHEGKDPENQSEIIVVPAVGPCLLITTD